MMGVMKFWPVLVVAAGVVASGAVDNYRITANANEVDDNAESIDENEEAIEGIQRLLIQRQGTQALELQRIENEQKAQGRDLEQILLLLERLTDQ